MSSCSTYTDHMFNCNGFVVSGQRGIGLLSGKWKICQHFIRRRAISLGAAFQPSDALFKVRTNGRTLSALLAQYFFRWQSLSISDKQTLHVISCLGFDSTLWKCRCDSAFQFASKNDQRVPSIFVFYLTIIINIPRND